MSPDAKPLGVRLVGCGPYSRFARERLQLRSDFRILDEAPSQESIDGRSIVCLTGAPPADQVAAVIQSSEHVVLESIGHFSSDQLKGLAELATKYKTIAVVDESRRWDEDFLCAWQVLESGRLGTLSLARLSIHETALPGEFFPRGLLRNLGLHWLDQLLVFTDDSPASAQLRRFSHDKGDTGFLAVIEFKGGLSAMVEVHTRSLLSLRTGWLLEGSTGAYRTGRQYTQAADGEIIDEPVSLPPRSTDPFFDALAGAIRGESIGAQLSDLAHAARVIELIEMLEAS